MRLEDYVSEAISSGKNRLNKFPRVADKEMVVKWLESNGFRKVTIKVGITSTLIQRLARENHGRIYYMGDYNYPIHEWIAFATEDNMFLIRTGEANKFDDAMRIRDISGGKMERSKIIKDIDEFADTVDKILG